jgi:hypothetical protein
VLDNVTRFCQEDISNDCLEANTAEVCTNQLIDRLLAEQASSGGRGGGTPFVAVVVPVVLGGWGPGQEGVVGVTRFGLGEVRCWGSGGRGGTWCGVGWDGMGRDGVGWPGGGCGVGSW